MVLVLTELKYIEPTETLIDMMVQIDRGRPFPFTYHPMDRSELTALITAELAANPQTPAPYVAPPPPPVLTVAERFDKFLNRASRAQGLTPAEFIAELKLRLTV